MNHPLPTRNNKQETYKWEGNGLTCLTYEVDQTEEVETQNGKPGNCEQQLKECLQRQGIMQYWQYDLAALNSRVSEPIIEPLNI